VRSCHLVLRDRASQQHERCANRAEGPAAFAVRAPFANHCAWNAACTGDVTMRTTIGDLVSELVDQYEAIYDDHELAAVAAEVTLDDILHENQERKRRPAPRKGKRR
jgi:hypothetical protein